jgi:hypothetical protein
MVKFLIVLLASISFGVSASVEEIAKQTSILREMHYLKGVDRSNINGGGNLPTNPVQVWLVDDLPFQQADGNRTPVMNLAGSGAIFCHGFDGPLDAATDHYWPFDGNANDIQGGENGTIVGGADFVAGVPGRPGDQAIDLDGATQRVDIPLTVGTALSGLTSISFSAFVNFDTIGGTGSNDTVFMLRRAAGGNHQILVRIFDDGTFNITSRPNVTDTQALVSTGAGLISIGQWHHIAAVLDVTARSIRMYVDGQLIKQGDVSASWGVASSFDGVTSHATYGADISSATIRWMDGRINDARLFHRALDDAEVAELEAWSVLCRVDNQGKKK